MMIRRNMAETYESAAKIAARKSIWMVLYLRARRYGDNLKAFYRRKALEENKG